VVLALNGVRRAIDGLNKLGESHGGERDRSPSVETMRRSSCGKVSR
jgi:hypothetical protein